MAIEDIAEKQDQLGSLKPVGKVRKEFICRECKEIFPIGSPCYNQNDYRDVKAFFPVPTKVCVECAEKLIADGAEVKKPKPKQKKVKEGCGGLTEYPKTNSNDFWKCGEENTVIGAVLCAKCNAKKLDISEVKDA